MGTIIGYAQRLPVYEQRKAQTPEDNNQASDPSEGGAEIAADLMSSDEDEDKLDEALNE